MRAATEEYITPSIEDFKVGDRVYRYLGLQPGTFGRVESIHDGFVLVEMDNGDFEGAPIAAFDQEGSVWEWDKFINIEDIKVGSRLSCREAGTRLFAKVERYVPGEELVIRYDTPVKTATDIATVTFKKPAKSTGLTFEHLLLGWKLEN